MPVSNAECRYRLQLYQPLDRNLGVWEIDVFQSHGYQLIRQAPQILSRQSPENWMEWSVRRVETLLIVTVRFAEEVAGCFSC